MAIYIVAYDIDDEGRANAIRARLDEIEAKDKAVHVQKSVWLVRSTSTLSGVASHLRGYLEESDSLLVGRVRSRDDIVIWGDGGANLSTMIEMFLDDGGF